MGPETAKYLAEGPNRSQSYPSVAILSSESRKKGGGRHVSAGRFEPPTPPPARSLTESVPSSGRATVLRPPTY